MKITKQENEFGLNISLEEDNKCLSIFYGSNFDLYWTIRSNKRIIDNNIKNDTFIITKENYALYSLFEDLYNDIKEINLFEDSILDKERYRLYNYSNYHELFDENNSTITWYSDETAHEVANYLKVKKDYNCFIIIFHIQDYMEGFDRDFASLYYIPVRFRNSGSRYDPFNIIFMRMYEKLKKIDDVNEYGHQIHMEEFLYSNKKNEKKLCKTKTL